MTNEWTPHLLTVTLMRAALGDEDAREVVDDHLAPLVDFDTENPVELLVYAARECGAEDFVAAYADAVGLHSPPSPADLAPGRKDAADGLRLLAGQDEVPPDARETILAAAGILDSVA